MAFVQAGGDDEKTPVAVAEPVTASPMLASMGQMETEQTATATATEEYDPNTITNTESAGTAETAPSDFTAASASSFFVAMCPKPPKQRAQWKDVAVPAANEEERAKIDLARVEEEAQEEWEVMFLDLFYVSAISNLSELLKSSWIAYEGVEAGGPLVYFFAAFFGIFLTWYQHCLYQTTFITSEFHRFVNRVRMVFVAVAIFNIKEYKYMSDHDDMYYPDDWSPPFYFCLGLTIDSFISFLLRVETLIRCDGIIREDSKIVISMVYIPRLGFYIAAWVLNDTATWPYLILCGSILSVIAHVVGEIILKCKGLLQKKILPVEEAMYLVRMGTWVSIVLGESIISLLNPDIRVLGNDYENSSRRVSTILGVLTTMNIYGLYFIPTPNVVGISGIIKRIFHLCLVQLLSLFLIAIGVADYSGLENQQFYKAYNLTNLTGHNQSRTFEEWYEMGVLDPYGTELVRTESISYRITSISAGWASGPYIQRETIPDSDPSVEVSKPIEEVYRTNQLYYFGLVLALLTVEGIFWFSQENVVSSVKRMIMKFLRGQGSFKQACPLFIPIFQLCCLVSVGVLSQTLESFYTLDNQRMHAIGFSITLFFNIIRKVMVRGKLVEALLHE